MENKTSKWKKTKTKKTKFVDIAIHVKFKHSNVEEERKKTTRIFTYRTDKLDSNR